jgi:hypothetical protein
MTQVLREPTLSRADVEEMIRSALARLAIGSGGDPVLPGAFQLSVLLYSELTVLRTNKQNGERRGGGKGGAGKGGTGKGGAGTGDGGKGDCSKGDGDGNQRERGHHRDP